MKVSRRRSGPRHAVGTARRTPRVLRRRTARRAAGGDGVPAWPLANGRSNRSRGPGAFEGPSGGLLVCPGLLRRWHWSCASEGIVAQVRCRGEQWYLLRAGARDDADGVARGAGDDEDGPAGATGACGAEPEFLVTFESDQGPLGTRAVRPAPLGWPAERQWLGWTESPPGARRLRVSLPWPAARRIGRLTVHPVSERDPCCHPLANVPRWTRYIAPTIGHVVLPPELEPLTDVLCERPVRVLSCPRSLEELDSLAEQGAAILADAWIERLGLDWGRLERLAHRACVAVSLRGLVCALRRSGLAFRVAEYSSAHGLVSARVEYADFPTRGFALGDVFPYGWLDGEGLFTTRVIVGRGAWRRWAACAAVATLLSSQTPWARRSGDALCAICPTSRGVLLASDLPWIVAGRHGAPIAPRLARHALRMALGLELDDDIQFWNCWDDPGVLVRDLADLPRRCPGLWPVRWADEGSGLVRLGLALRPAAPKRHVLIVTRRIDRAGLHDGLAPEPMIIFMKMLARRARDPADPLGRVLNHLAVTWQFDSAQGARYAMLYESAQRRGLVHADARLDVYEKARNPHGAMGPDRLVLRTALGILGEGSLELLAELTAGLHAWLRRQACATGSSSRPVSSRQASR